MQLNLTSRQTIYLFCVVVFLSSRVLGGLFKDDKVTTCCPSANSGRFRGRIQKCAYVPAKGRLCKEAYVFTTEDGRDHCTSVNAKWVNSTMKTLEKRGRPCETTAKKIN